MHLSAKNSVKTRDMLKRGANGENNPDGNLLNLTLLRKIFTWQRKVNHNFFARQIIFGA